MGLFGSLATDGRVRQAVSHYSFHVGIPMDSPVTMLSRFGFERTAPRHDRIFISYRRSDTTGSAGRLEDTLSRYFGEGRVFRDVGGIGPGEDFQHKIAHSLENAGALVVLIGPDWLAENEKGSPRLHEPGDHVAGEIVAALEKNLLVVPVLVEGARMPPEGDLPDRLRPLSRRNAITVNDETWDGDATRLAKVLSFDISGSVAERRLNWLKLGVVIVLAAPLMFTIIAFVSVSVTTFNQLIMVVSPVSIVVAFLALAATTSWIDPSRRKYVWAAVIVGFSGLLIALLKYLIAGNSGACLGDLACVDEIQSRIAFLSSTVIAVAMLALLALAGFKPNDRVH